ncbi:hypothetical protein TNCV_3410611 [Trichonephila clavipes]|nr:hypothetical protein TNCV_3410611 [Trichonephila clavipes]
MFNPSSFVNPTPLAHADTSRDVLPMGGTSITNSVSLARVFFLIISFRTQWQRVPGKANFYSTKKEDGAP